MCHHSKDMISESCFMALKPEIRVYEKHTTLRFEIKQGWHRAPIRETGIRVAEFIKKWVDTCIQLPKITVKEII